MSLSVNFYNFQKKLNSTAQPSGSGTTVTCLLKSESGIAAPVLRLAMAGAPSYNYCHITEYGRYYYVKEWTYVDHCLWECSLVCDILATFKSAIGAASLYILRSSSAYDGEIVDTLYPAKTDSDTGVEVGLSPWIHTTGSDNISLSQGTFIIGYVTKNLPNSSAMYGSVIYSAMEQSGLTALVRALLDDSLLSDNGFELNDASLALQKSLVDPLGYIKSVLWIPVLYSSIDGSELTEINIWDWTIDADHKILSNNPPYMVYSIGNLPIAKHPQTSARGNFVNVSPYTRFNLDYPPFGNIELDTTLTANASQVNGYVMLDMVTGIGTLKVIIDSVEQSRLTAQVGVPIQLSQVSKDYLSAIQSTGNGVIGTVGNLLSGNIVGAVQSGFNGIMSSAAAMLSRESSTGGAGSFSGLRDRPRLYHQFMIIADEDLSHKGRPLCQVRTVSTLSGFLQALDGDIEVPGFEGEAEYIKQMLESGIFYE